MVPDSLIAMAEDVVQHLAAKGIKLCLVESSSGGLAAAILTTIPGSSQVLDMGIAAYSNESKVRHLGLSQELLENRGAVSGEVAMEMAKGGLKLTDGNLCLAETSIAGPTGGTPEKPVGLSYLAMADAGGKQVYRKLQFKGDRRSVRVQVVSALFDWLMEK